MPIPSGSTAISRRPIWGRSRKATQHLGCRWKELPIGKDAEVRLETHYTRIFRIWRRWVTERPDLTAQGYRRFRCRDCGRQFNERSDGVLNGASLPSDIIAFKGFCRLRYRLTLRDLSEIMLLRGFTVSHECIRQWEAKLLPVMGEVWRKRRHGTGAPFRAKLVCR
jgi:hypothetical protein